jgi:hypothetical protein
MRNGFIAGRSYHSENTTGWLHHHRRRTIHRKHRKHRKHRNHRVTEPQNTENAAITELQNPEITEITGITDNDEYTG